MLKDLRKMLTPKPGAASSKMSAKNWVAYTLFGAIIVVFVLWGVHPDHYGASAVGGVAAVVNDTSISIAEYKNRVENVEQNARGRMDQFPEAQRAKFMADLRREALEDLIQNELVFQAAAKGGVRAADGEVREQILELPFLQEGGRFQRELYRKFIANMGMSSEDFERQIRKQIVGQKLQRLFVGSATPSREEIRRSEELSQQKISLRFVQFHKADFARPGFVKESDIQAFAPTVQGEVKQYYETNKIMFTTPERIKARHILVRIDTKRPDAEAAKLIAQIHKEATPASFAALASKYSDDPVSKAKGGDLGEFDRNAMAPEFGAAAFSLEPGKVSDPVKTTFGYHLILVEKKTPSSVKPITEVQGEIARELYVRQKEGEIVASLRKLAESKNKAELDALVSRMGSKWQETGEFDLSTPAIPKLGSNPGLIAAVMKHGRTPGLIGTVTEQEGGYIVAELVSWKTSTAPAVQPAAMMGGLERMMAYRKAGEVIEGWSKSVSAGANIQRNPRILQ